MRRQRRPEDEAWDMVSIGILILFEFFKYMLEH
jgi:hypothetical protein